MNRLLTAAALAGALAIAAPLQAQGLSLSVRGGGGLATGAFADAATGGSSDASLAGAEHGFGLGLDAMLSLGSRAGVYAGFDQIRFRCADESCGSDGEYRMGGFTAGLQLTPVRLGTLTPWLRGGITLHELRGTHGTEGIRFSSEREPGFEVGAGINIPIMGMLSVSPQLRYVGQSTRLRVPGLEAPEAKQNVGYMTFDLGLGIHTPFGGRR